MSSPFPNREACTPLTLVGALVVPALRGAQEPERETKGEREQGFRLHGGIRSVREGTTGLDEVGSLKSPIYLRREIRELRV